MPQIEQLFDSVDAGFLQRGLIGTAALIVGLWVAYKVVSRIGHRLVDQMAVRGKDAAARADTLWAIVRRLLLIVFFAVGVLWVPIVWGLNVAPLLAVGSVIGVAVGFGAQDLVRDVIAGFFILAEDQYRIGDVVRVAGVAGEVEDIRPRVTVLRDLDGNVHYVPNGEIKVASNLTQVFAQVVVDVGVAYKEPVDRVIEVIGDELRAMQRDPDWGPQIMEEPTVLGVDQLADSAVVIRALIKVTAEDRWGVRREALRRLKNRLDAEGIEIPFPHLTLYYGEPAPRREPAGEGTTT